VATLVGIAIAEWVLAQALDARGAFAYYNTLFDSDANIRVWMFGSGWGDFSLVHPWGWLPSLPIRAYALALRLAGSGVSEPMLRREMALVLNPACAALSAGLILGVAWRARLGPWRAMLVTLGFSLFFAQSLFGGVPDYPVVGGLTVAAVLALAGWESAEGRPAAPWAWFLVVLASASVTATNAIPAAAAFVVSRRVGGERWARTVGVLAGMTAVVAGLSLLGVAVGRALYHPEAVAVSGVVARYAHPPSAFDVLVRVPVAFASSISPDWIGTQPNPLAARAGGPDLALTLEPETWRAWLSPGLAVTVVLVALAARSLLRRRDRWSAVALAALAVLAHSWLLHAWYGRELAYYAANWTPALGVLLVTALRVSPLKHAWGTALLSGLVVALGAALAAHLAFVLRVLGGA
jgi:hypothetical protein